MSKLKPNQFILSGHLITELPILFQPEMVQAILEDRKNQTRRTNKLDLINECPVCWGYHSTLPSNDIFHLFGRLNKENKIMFFERVKSPYGKPGDLLYVRENWFDCTPYNNFPAFAFRGLDGILFQADGQFIADHKWKPSIHLKKSDSRIWVMVEDIRVERVQDISEEDAIAEGIFASKNPGYNTTVYKDYLNPKSDYFEMILDPIGSFQSLFISINGEVSWNSNPWVWVIKYRILSKTGRPSDDLILKNYLEVTSHKAVVSPAEAVVSVSTNHP